MSKQQMNVGAAGKEPDNPTMLVPSKFYEKLKTFVWSNNPEHCKFDLQNMLVLSLRANEMDGKTYSEMAQFVFEL